MTDLRNYTTASIGIRSNNPGNLVSNNIDWKGKVGTNSRGFVIFSSAEYGIRAMGMDIKNDINKGLNTLAKYIAEYDPGNTQAYIDYVSSKVGISRNMTLVPDANTLFKLIRSHIDMENGQSGKLVTDRMIRDGISLMPGSSVVKSSGLNGNGWIFLLIIPITILLLFKIFK